MHRLGGRCILDQLEHPVAEDDAALAGGDVGPDLKRFRVRQGDQPVALVRLDVPDQEDLSREALTRDLVDGGGLEVVLDVDNLLTEELHPLLVGPVQPFQIVNGVLYGGGADLILLLDEIEVRMLGPHPVGEPAVLGLAIGRGHGLARRQRCLCFERMAQCLPPIADLPFDQLAGIRRHFGPVGRHRLGIKLGPRTLQTMVRFALGRERADQPFGQFINSFQIRVQPRQGFSLCVRTRVGLVTSVRIRAIAIRHCLPSRRHAATAK